MTGHEKITNMSLEELARKEFCPSNLGLEEDEELCGEFNSCNKCRKKALEAEIE